MPTDVDRHRTRELAGSGARLLEVLPRSDYERGHLPGATSLPLGELAAPALAHLGRDEPIIVYCFDQQ